MLRNQEDRAIWDMEYIHYHSARKGFVEMREIAPIRVLGESWEIDRKNQKFGEYRC